MPRPRLGKSKIDVGRALELQAEGVPMAKIASGFEVNPRTVQRRLAKLMLVLQNNTALQEFRAKQPELQDHIMSLCIMGLEEALADPLRRAKIWPHHFSIIYGTLFDKQRLLLGQSTANVNVLSVLIEQVHRPRTAPTTDHAEDGPSLHATALDTVNPAPDDLDPPSTDRS